MKENDSVNIEFPVKKRCTSTSKQERTNSNANQASIAKAKVYQAGHAPIEQVKNDVLNYVLAPYLDIKSFLALGYSSKTLFANTKQQCEKLLTEKLLYYVMRSELDKVAVALEKNPNLLKMKGTITDLSGRPFRNITPLQYAQWALDNNMQSLMAKYLSQDKITEQRDEFCQRKDLEHGEHFSFDNTLEMYDVFFGKL